LFIDQDGLPIDVLQSPLREVLARLYRAWQHVGSLHVTRHGFAGLHAVDAATTAKHLRLLDVEQQPPLRVLLAGAFITADQQGNMFRVDSEDRVCKFCPIPDSLHHRHWLCPHTQESRNQICPTDLAIIQQQPPCFQEHGRCVELPIVRQFRQALIQVPDSSGNFHYPPHLPNEFDCFTDGAASDPQHPVTRISTWGWVLGDTLSGHFWPIAETVVRAEIFAVLSVARFVHQFPRRTRIWCVLIGRRQSAATLG